MRGPLACPVVKKTPLLLFALLTLSVRPVMAVRPFITDDARVVGEYLAQMETWVRGDTRTFQHWLLLAVGPWAPIELTVGVLHGASYDGEPASYAVHGPLLQAKALLVEPRPNRWPGLALSLGATAPAGYGQFTTANWERFAYLAVTESLFREDRLLLHANVGITVVNAEHGGATLTTATWGVGMQLRTFAGLHLVAELVSGDPYEPTSGGAGQTGFRYIVSDRVQLDATVGAGLWGDSPLPVWGTAGIRLVAGPINKWLRRQSGRSADPQ